MLTVVGGMAGARSAAAVKAGTQQKRVRMGPWMGACSEMAKLFGAFYERTTLGGTQGKR